MTYPQLQSEISLRHLNNDNPQMKERLQKRYSIALHRVTNYIKPNHKILDIGGRDGACLRYFFGKGFCKSTLVDIAIDTIPSNSNGVTSDGHKLPFVDKSFDLVLMLHSLEHCYEPYQVLEEVQRILGHGGLFYAITPIEEFKKVPTKGGHYSFFAKYELYKLTKQYFDVILYEADWVVGRKQ